MTTSRAISVPSAPLAGRSGAARGRAALAGLLVLCACGGDAPGVAEPLDFPAVPGLDPAAARALEEARERVRAEPSAAPAWGRLGMQYHATDLLPQALDAYARAEKLDPSEPRWPYFTGLVLDRQGLGTEALAAWTRALERSRDSYPPIHWRMGGASLAAFDLDRAESAFQSSIAAAPQDVAGWFGLARVLLLREQPDEAMEAARQGLARDPSARWGHALVADAWRRKKRLDEAERELALAGDATPVYRDAWADELPFLNAESYQTRFQRAAALFEMGKLVECIAPLEVLLRDDPENRSVAKLLAEAYSRSNRLPAAEAAFAELLAAEPGDRQTLVAWIEHCLRNGKRDDARAALATLLRLHPEDGQAHWFDGFLAEKQGELARALAAYRRSLFHDRRNTGTLLAIARLELELRHGAEARDAFEEVRAAGVASAELELGLGQALLLLDDFAGARAALARARALPAANTRALERLEQAIARREGQGG